MPPPPVGAQLIVNRSSGPSLRRRRNTTPRCASGRPRCDQRHATQHCDEMPSRSNGGAAAVRSVNHCAPIQSVQRDRALRRRRTIAPKITNQFHETLRSARSESVCEWPSPERSPRRCNFGSQTHATRAAEIVRQVAPRISRKKRKKNAKSSSVASPALYDFTRFRTLARIGRALLPRLPLDDT